MNDKKRVLKNDPIGDHGSPGSGSQLPIFDRYDPRNPFGNKQMDNSVPKEKPCTDPELLRKVKQGEELEVREEHRVLGMARYIREHARKNPDLICELTKMGIFMAEPLSEEMDCKSSEARESPKTETPKK